MASKRTAAKRTFRGKTITSEVTLASIEELIEWAEAEGWLDDSVLLATDVEGDEVRLLMGLRVIEHHEDPREAFDRTHEKLFEFTLVCTRATLSKGAPHGGFQVIGAPEQRLGLDLDVEGNRVELRAGKIRVLGHEEAQHPVELAFGRELTFHGPGPITNGEIQRGVAACGVKVDGYANWKGSGQSMGSAFVETTKPEIAKDEPLSSSLRVVRAGLPAPHPTGLWLTGQSLSSFAYVTITPTSECDQGLLRAVVETLASHPGVSWASSGNRTLKAREDREQWLAAVSRLCATSTEIR